MYVTTPSMEQVLCKWGYSCNIKVSVYKSQPRRGEKSRRHRGAGDRRMRHALKIITRAGKPTWTHYSEAVHTTVRLICSAIIKSLGKI